MLKVLWLCFEKSLLIRNWMDGWIDKNKIRKCLCFFGRWRHTGCWNAEPGLLVIVLGPSALRSEGTEWTSRSVITCPPKIPASETSQSIWPAILTLGQRLLWFWLAVIKNLGSFYLCTWRIGGNLFTSDGAGRWNLSENGGLLPNRNKGRRNCTD